MTGDQESVSPVCATITLDLPHQTLEENSGTLTRDPHHYKLGHDNQLNNHVGRDLRWHICAANSVNISL